MAFFQKLKYGLTRLLNRKPSSVIHSVVDPTASVGNGAQLVNCTVGRYSYIYDSSAAGTKIGAFCSIAAGCSIGGGSHPTDWVSTSPVFYKGKNVLKRNFSQLQYEEFRETFIGNDVWIGAKCLIKGGVTIGDGAVIGMGSVVTHDVPSYEIWAGNPARCIRKRFDDDTIKALQTLKWWELEDQELKRLGHLFDDPTRLIGYLEGKML